MTLRHPPQNRHGPIVAPTAITGTHHWTSSGSLMDAAPIDKRQPSQIHDDSLYRP